MWGLKAAESQIPLPTMPAMILSVANRLSIAILNLCRREMAFVACSALNPTNCIHVHWAVFAFGCLMNKDFKKQKCALSGKEGVKKV
jgi:hypothetical protein